MTYRLADLASTPISDVTISKTSSTTLGVCIAFQDTAETTAATTFYQTITSYNGVFPASDSYLTALAPINIVNVLGTIDCSNSTTVSACCISSVSAGLASPPPPPPFSPPPPASPAASTAVRQSQVDVTCLRLLHAVMFYCARKTNQFL